MVILAPLLLLLILASFYAIFRGLDRIVPRMSIVAAIIYMLTFLPFALGLLLHSHDYYEAIDIVDEHYSPFATTHVVTLIFYFAAYHFAAWNLWIKGAKLPPLFRVLCLVFILIGLGINGAGAIQVFGSTGSESTEYDAPDNSGILFLPFLVMSLVIGLVLLLKSITLEGTAAATRSFKNPFLNHLNQLLLHRLNAPVWAFIFLLPVFLVCTLILILLGQDANSLVKAFTDTTTWTFSQRVHPPALDHRGHYLCTVAAQGNPKTVKPILIGRRGGQPIIVNRQLQIANAFEELVGDISPPAHRIIRKAYDKWGYNLSRKINTEKRSNAVYMLMKPLEWVFLLCLYLGCTKPEEKIRRQYQMHNQSTR